VPAEAVLICGAGPTGLTLALELARFGVPFRIVDSAAEPARFSQALAVHARTLELLEPTGITAPLLEVAHRISGVNVYDGRRQLADVSFTGMPTAYDYIASIPQRVTEQLMILRLRELGVTVERETTLTALQCHESEGGEATLVHDGKSQRTRFSYLAACDGAHSTVRQLRSIPLGGHAAAETFMLADADLETDLPSDRISIFLRHDGGVLAFLPIGYEWRIVVAAPRDMPANPTLADFQREIDALDVLKARVTETTWTAHYHVQQRRVKHYRDGCVFFLGDAAHIHSPIGGQGMNAGIHDAINLAWKLALVIHDDARATLLHTYAEERESTGRALLEWTDIGNRIMLSGNPLARTLRNAAASLAHLDTVRDRLRESIAELRVGYPRSSLSVHGRTHGRGTIAGTRIRTRPSGYHPQMLISENGHFTTFVVRPDGYVGYAADGVHESGANIYLRNVIGLTRS
jgi:2-polyprenyl-6-methoxyphenol hydroxylase-like FAD-dependent oxidoreductase